MSKSTMSHDAIVKRMLVTAVKRAQKNGHRITHGKYGLKVQHGKFVANKKCCPIGAYLDGKKALETTDSFSEVAAVYLALSGNEIDGLVNGVDNLILMNDDTRQYKAYYRIGKELRERFIKV